MWLFLNIAEMFVYYLIYILLLDNFLKMIINEQNEIITTLDIKDEVLSQVEKTYKISRNEFFITAEMLAIAFYNKKESIKTKNNL